LHLFSPPSSPDLIHRCPVKCRVDDWFFLPVMAGFGPAIHDFTDRAKDVDDRPKGGHDEMRQPVLNRTEVDPIGG
jgi:hypothetical protein